MKCDNIWNVNVNVKKTVGGHRQYFCHWGWWYTRWHRTSEEIYATQNKTDYSAIQMVHKTC